MSALSLLSSIRKHFGGALLAIAAAIVPLAAQSASVRVDSVEVELVAETTALQAGQPAWIGLRIRHDPHWHTYWRNPGDSGLATTLEVQAPSGFGVGALQWPLPSRFLIPPLASYGYEGDLLLPLKLDVPVRAAGERVRLEAKASWLMCREVCIPGDASLSLELPVLASQVAADRSPQAVLFERALASLPSERLALPAAMVGDSLTIDFASLSTATSPRPRIEFFPYSESGLKHAAPQRILSAPDAPARASRIALALSDEGRALFAKDLAEATQTLGAGVLVVGDRIIEVAPRAVAAASLSGGAELARVEAVAVTLPASGTPTSGVGGVLSRLGIGAGGGAGVTSPRTSAVPAAPAASSAGADSALPVVLLFALLGGMILNLMPCVFPVIGLKVLAFAEHAHEPTGRKLLHPAGVAQGARGSALAFAAGVVLSFLALGLLMLALKAAGVSAGWGFQLQEPVFVSAMALLFSAIGLNLAGLFEIGVGLTRLGRFDAAAHAPTGSARRLSANLGSGALAVLVATPCTAPFMASALGFTLSGSMFESLAVFAAIGLGMALPYLLLGWFPAWLRWLPRPGRWMESLRQFLAFPMFATTAWLAWVLGQQAGIDAVFALAVAIVLLALGAWLFGRFVQTRGLSHARLAALGGLTSVAGALWLAVHFAASGDAVAGPAATQGSASSSASWEPWSQQRVAQGLAEGRPVFVDFTAAWCVSCQANKKLVLDREAVVQDMARRGVLRLRADWTQRDPAITAELASHGRNGVPLYLLYESGTQSPKVLPELLTVGTVSDALAALPVRR